MLLTQIILLQLFAVITIYSTRTDVQKPKLTISNRPSPQPPPSRKKQNSANDDTAVLIAAASGGSGYTSSRSTPANDLHVNNFGAATETPVIGKSLRLDVQKSSTSIDATPLYPVQAEILIENGQSSLQLYNERLRNLAQHGNRKFIPQCSAICNTLKPITSNGDGTFACSTKLLRRKRAGEESATCSKSDSIHTSVEMVISDAPKHGEQIQFESGNVYIVRGKPLGRGNYALIESVMTDHNGVMHYYAMKAYDARVQESLIRNEITTLKLTKSQEVTLAPWYVDDDFKESTKKKFVVQTLTGKSWLIKRIEKGSPYSEAETRSITIGALTAIEMFHDKTGLCHNDVKIDNFVAAIDDDTKVMTVDFQMSYPYKTTAEGIERFHRKDDVIAIIEDFTAPLMAPVMSTKTDFQSHMHMAPGKKVEKLSIVYHRILQDLQSLEGHERPDYQKYREWLLSSGQEES